METHWHQLLDVNGHGTKGRSSGLRGAALSPGPRAPWQAWRGGWRPRGQLLASVTLGSLHLQTQQWPGNPLGRVCGKPGEGPPRPIPPRLCGSDSERPSPTGPPGTPAAARAHEDGEQEVRGLRVVTLLRKSHAVDTQLQPRDLRQRMEPAGALLCPEPSQAAGSPEGPTPGPGRKARGPGGQTARPGRSGTGAGQERDRRDETRPPMCRLCKADTWGRPRAPRNPVPTNRP